jgi:putative FmdB family regulatory protein
MPIYEYQCQKCGEHHEALQKMSDPELTDCPACQTPNLKKLISAAGFQLKGSGWYATDFRNKEQKPKESKAEACDNGGCSANGGNCAGSDAA